MEASIALTTKLSPSNIRKDSKACISLAWDNFDINLETLSGAGSIHHTYGICYQNINFDEQERGAVDNSNDAYKEYTEEFASVTVNNRKRKITEISNSISKDSLNDNLEPYFKKSTMNMFSFPRSNAVCPDSYWEQVSLDIFWAFLFNISLKPPMWTRWNSMRHEERLLLQTVGYMKPITFPATRNDAMLETLKRSKGLAAEMGTENIVMT